MKKSKLLLSSIGIGTILTGLSTISGCVLVNPQEDEPKLTISGGALNLMCQARPSSALTYDVAPYAWKVKLDDKQVDGWQDYCKFIMVDGPSDLPDHFLMGSDSYFYWGPISDPGVYKFKIEAPWYDSETKQIYRAQTDVITLTVLEEEQQGCLPPISNIIDTSNITRTGGVALSTTATIHGLTFVGLDQENLPKIEMKQIVGPGEEEVITFRNARIVDPSYEFYPYYNVVADIDGLDKGVPAGNYPISLTITDEQTGYTFLNNYQLNFVSSFSEDTWENVTYYANQGIDALKQHYGIDNFVGLTRVVNILGKNLKVKVVGQEHDHDENGNVLPLTFQFETPIETGIIASVERFRASTLLTGWDSNNDGNGHYWESDINKALNGDLYDKWWEITSRDDFYGSIAVQKLKLTQSISQLMPSVLTRAIKPAVKTVTTFSHEKRQYVSTQKATPLFLPTVASIFSSEAIAKSERWIFTYDQKQLITAEDTQYEYYKTLELNDLWKESGYQSLNKWDFEPSTSYGVCYWLATPYVNLTSSEGNEVWTIQYENNSSYVGASHLRTHVMSPESDNDYYAIAPLFCI